MQISIIYKENVINWTVVYINHIYHQCLRFDKHGKQSQQNTNNLSLDMSINSILYDCRLLIQAS